eukprot:3631551-Amphidinium_carterae.1
MGPCTHRLFVKALHKLLVILPSHLLRQAQGQSVTPSRVLIFCPCVLHGKKEFSMSVCECTPLRLVSKVVMRQLDGILTRCALSLCFWKLAKMCLTQDRRNTCQSCNNQIFATSNRPPLKQVSEHDISVHDCNEEARNKAQMDLTQLCRPYCEGLRHRPMSKTTQLSAHKAIHLSTWPNHSQQQKRRLKSLSMGRLPPSF